MIRHIALLLFLLFFWCFGFCQNPKAQKINIPGSSLTNIYAIDKDVYRSEQPTSADFKALERYGIKEVVNLRFWHSDRDEAEGIFLILHHIRTNAFSIDEQEIIEILRIIKKRKGPVVFHCLHGSDRTGVVCAMYRIIFQGVSKEDAIKELTEGGFGYHKIFYNIIVLIRNADITRMKQKIEAP